MAWNSIDFFILPYVKFNGYFLINKLPDSGKVINTYISYTLNEWSRNLNTNFILNNSLFKSVKLTNDVAPDKYEYSSWSIGFGYSLEFWLTDGNVGKNVIVFKGDMSSSVLIDNANNDALYLDVGPKQRLNIISILNNQEKICIMLTL